MWQRKLAAVNCRYSQFCVDVVPPTVYVVRNPQKNL